MEFVILAVTPIAGHGGGVIGGNLDQDDLDAIGVLDPPFGQAPGLRCGFADDGCCGHGQPGSRPDVDDLRDARLRASL